MAGGDGLRAPEAGAVIGGRYRVRREIGAGGMGSVLEVEEGQSDGVGRAHDLDGLGILQREGGTQPLVAPRPGLQHLLGKPAQVLHQAEPQHDRHGP